MESTTREIIARNERESDAHVQACKDEFATVTEIGRAEVGSISGGQGKWVIVRPASPLTARQRKELASLGWSFARDWSDGQGRGRRLTGWSK